MAVMKASLGVTRPRRPHNEAMVSSAFRMFSVAVSSVLKQDGIRPHQSKLTGWKMRNSSFTWHLEAETEQPEDHTSRH